MLKYRSGRLRRSKRGRRGDLGTHSSVGGKLSSDTSREPRPLFSSGHQALVHISDESYLTNGFWDNTVIDSIPTMEGITLKYLPTFITRTTEPNNFLRNYFLKTIDTTRRASAIIFNTFSMLDNQVLSAAESHHSCRLPYMSPLVHCSSFWIIP
ncbi:UDP-glycosyltransferase 85A1-like protein [Drosera capensis]